METCSPTFEEKIASNVLAFWSLSDLDLTRSPLQERKGFIIINNNSRRSSASMADFASNNSSSSNASDHSEARKQACASSDVDEDGVHGGRMKPLSSLDGSYRKTGRKCWIPHFSNEKGPKSPANPTPSKVLAAAREGRRARRRTISHSDGKENNIMAHIREMQAMCKKHKWVKRKSLAHKGHTCSPALKWKRSALSTWRAETSNAKTASARSEITQVRDMDYASNLACQNLQTFTNSPDKVNSSSKVACPLLRAQNHFNTVEAKATISQGSLPQGLSLLGAATCLTLTSDQGLPLPMTGSGKGKGKCCFSSIDHPGKGMPESLPLTKEEIITGLSYTKPPTYPKVKHTLMSIVKVKDKGHLVVNASQPSSQFSDMPCGDVKIEECSEHFAGETGLPSQAAGKYQHIAETKLTHVNHSRFNLTESSGFTEDINSQEEAFKKVFSTQFDLTQKLPGLSRDPDLLKLSSSKAGNPCESEKAVILRQSPCLVNAPTVQTVLNGADGKLEKSFKDSAELCIKVGNADLNFEDDSRHLCSIMPRAQENLSCSTKESIKGPLSHNSDAQNLLKLPGQFGTYDHNTLPNSQHCTNVNGTQSCNKSVVSATEVPANCFTYGARAATGSTLCHRRIAHGNICLPKLRRGRQPKKINVCPGLQRKEHVNKFARICAPSGILGDLNPGIINRLRDKKQVHAALGAVIGAAIMHGSSYGKGDLVRLQGGQQAASADANQGPHGEHKERSAKRRKSTEMKEREAHVALSATQDSASVTELVDRDTRATQTRDDGVRPGQVLNVIKCVDKDSMKDVHTARLRTPEVRKLENASHEYAATDANVHLSCSLQASEKGFKDVSMDRLDSRLQFSRADYQKQGSVQGLCDQKMLCQGGSQLSNNSSNVENQSAKNATAVGAAANVASCWLELLRLDIKGRLSALKRSRRRVRGVIVSGQLDDKMSCGNDLLKKSVRWDVVGAGGKDSQASNEMHKWRAFFLHMDGVLCSEGARLENWLSQIAEMQSHCQKNSTQSCMPPTCEMGACHCQKNSTQSCMPPKCKMGFSSTELEGATRLREAMESDPTLAASAASMFATANLAKTMVITS